MNTQNKTILFIEDERIHHQQVAAYLFGYRCPRVSWGDFGDIKQTAVAQQPLAAVVDFVLLTTSTGQRELDDLARAYLDGKRDFSPEAATLLEEHYGVASIPILRQACPGIKILLYTQNADADDLSKQVSKYHADAGVPKRRDPKRPGHLLESNAQEIAAKVRELIE